MSKDALDAFCLLALRAPLKTSTWLYQWAAGIVATFWPLLFRAMERPYDFAGGQILQSIGLLLQVAGIVPLTRSLGIVAANRVIKTDGLRRYVRHLLYHPKVLQQLGYVINNLSVRNSLSLALQPCFSCSG